MSSTTRPDHTAPSTASPPPSPTNDSPKPNPGRSPGTITRDARQRVRRDRVDNSGVVTLRYNGRLHHIGIGRAHARTPILLLVDDRDIRVINATTGELLRALTLDPTRDYQPIGTPKTKKPEP